MALELKVPSVGESIREIEIGQWLKKEGEAVREGETVAILESEKATVDLPAPVAGIMGRHLKGPGQVAVVGEVIGSIESAAAPGTASPPVPPTTVAATTPPPPGAASNVAAESAKAPEPKIMPAAERLLTEEKLPASDVTGTGPGGRMLKEDAQRAVDLRKTAAPAATSALPLTAAPAAAPAPASTVVPSGFRRDEVVRMSKLRRTAAARLVAAKQNMALLTTFNEVDLSQILALRKELQETFVARHGIKLGFMSFFTKAVIDGLKLIPQLNSEIRGDDIVYKNYYDIGVAIGGGRGLVVPVLRHAERMSFAEIERAIVEFAGRAKDGKLLPEELEGGTFTISNGGVYGSLLSTPIVNPPQSGVLGMHTIQERPIALNGQVVIRPMMYVALTYDHRIVDGKEAVTFLKRVKETLENPARLLLEA